MKSKKQDKAPRPDVKAGSVNEGKTTAAKTGKNNNLVGDLTDNYVYKAICTDERIELTGWVSKNEMEEANSQHHIDKPTHITDYKKKLK